MSVLACIVPHGSHLIPELAGDLLLEFEETRLAYQKIADAIYEFQPDTIVLATPHGVKLEKHISIATSEWVGGSLADNGNEVSVDFPADREFARHLLDAAYIANIPVIGTNYGTSAGPFSKVPLDWGALIPLWFVQKLAVKSKVVLISPTRDIDVTNMVKLGELIGQTSEALGKRTLLIASADQGHGHSETGPYGFAPESAEYDQLVCKLIQEQALDKLLELSPEFVDAAKPDSLWQMLILHGFLQKYPLHGELLSYQVPTYYGMICALYK